MKKVFSLFLLLGIFLPFFQKPVLAEETELEECQKYYQFGEVKVNLNTKQSSYTRGEKIEITGTVVNQNSFPLLNIIVFAHLKRLNQQTYLENGHFLVDKLTLASDLNFLPGETKELSTQFPVLDNYPQGQYQLQYFVFSKQGFYYSGRSFLEENFAGVTNFEIQNTLASEVFFDPDTLMLDGVPQKIRNYIPIFEKGQNTVIWVMLKDLRQSKSDLFINYKWYRWDDSFEKNLVKTGQIQLLAGQPPLVQTVFNLTEPGAYILYLELDQPTRSLFKFRIARRGEKAYNLRMNDLGITNYPIDLTKDRAFVCFHSPSEEDSPKTRVTLLLLNKEGQVLEERKVENSFGGEVVAISVPLVKLSDALNFSVETDFENLENPALSQKLKYDYHCHLFDQSLINLSTNYQGGKINLQSANLCGGQIADSYAEKVVIYQNGQIVKEAYNVKPLPSEIDTSDLPAGDYKLLVKSGEIEKEMEFRVGKKAGKRLLFLIIFALIISVSVISLILIQKRRKAKEENET